MSGPVADDDATRFALAAKGGDRAAATQFIRLTAPRVQRFLCHLVAPRDVEDATQESYLRAMRALPRFEAKASGLTWLLAIARRVAADHVRTEMRRPRVVGFEYTEETASDWRNVPLFDEGVVLRDLL